MWTPKDSLHKAVFAGLPKLIKTHEPSRPTALPNEHNLMQIHESSEKRGNYG